VGLELAGAITAERLANALNGKELLLLLDNCEHLVDAATVTAEAILRANPTARVIATSREPLRAHGEYIYPVPPLAVPAVKNDDKVDPLEYGSVRLFVERARAAEPHFAPNGRLMALLAVICRRLDGIPLAIELAAARAAALGVEELAARLDERFNLLTAGRRTALPRHQTMRATLDWSYGLLAEPERILLRRLAIFAGSFSLQAASLVAANPEAARSTAVEGLLSLVEKSLVASEVESAVARYRLLETTRAYALEKLDEASERERIVRRHAEYYRDVFERAEAEWNIRPTAEWLGEYGWQIDNMRAALDWAFSHDGDGPLGAALTAAAVPLWMHLSLLDECRGRVERSLAALAVGASRDAWQEMKLCAALGGALLFTRGSGTEIEVTWMRALTIAEGLASTEYQLRALWGLWSNSMHHGDYGIGLGIAQRFRSLALTQGDPNDLAMADRMIGVSLHFRGVQPDARRHIENMLAYYVAPVQRSPSARFVWDQKATAQLALARILSLQGFPDRAWSIVQTSVEDALAINNPFGLCFALTEAACPIACFIGNLVEAERYTRILFDRSSKHELPIWRSWAHRYQGTLLIWNGDLKRGLQVLRTSLEQPPEVDILPRYTWFVSQLAWGLGRAGQFAEATSTINEALARCERKEDGWYLAELLRIKGDLQLWESEATDTAEDLFRQALDVAQRQGALSWELRAAVSLAKLLSDQGRPGDALACLRPVYDRFSEGFETADLKAARALLDSLR
jgi:predicted ATPase